MCTAALGLARECLRVSSRRITTCHKEKLRRGSGAGKHRVRDRGDTPPTRSEHGSDQSAHKQISNMAGGRSMTTRPVAPAGPDNAEQPITAVHFYSTQ